MYSSMAVYFMRSAMAPTISDGVMIAKVSWYTQNTASGMVGASWWTESTVNPLNQNRDAFPHTGLDDDDESAGPKAKLYPKNIQSNVTMQVMLNICITVDKTFLVRTMPV